jgi:hypothetical protein
MRWRAAAVIALFGIAAIPGISAAAVPVGSPTVHVSVKPASGSPTTHFRVSFKAPQASGAVGGGNAYRITASLTDSGAGKCVSSTSAVASPTLAGATVHATLSPTAHRRWCAGTFHGQVWSILLAPCPVGKACPAILPLARMVGKFTFRVVRG